ncbi:hypothetical protein [Legionella hackeliae]|uniref:Uncharacterized protein n=1 Tax=Legionella hackeliae TaxID=449 RepID=A0A0A8UW99_LEGHA|nr:hypothetical protein [Legionella hackeliae]KTD15256.1 hypothetical protein Lhac_0098 [Legionella hackeliae]CEK11377.1 exported protein of unknown function [Legionella hackeliae]STX48149.1 Uncharacterized protein conserved in bacteria [Legionella hackeliae]
MLKMLYWSLLISLPTVCMSAETPRVQGAHEAIFKSKISSIPTDVQQQMKRYTWHKGCPVSLNDLRYVSLTHWGFDKKPHQGVLIVDKALAKEVTQIFKLPLQTSFSN